MTNGEEKRKGPDLVTVLAAVATAIGTLGWVAFIGGAILWISFSRANLPTAEAVARVPTGVMVGTGAEFVVWAVLAALVTVVALYIFDEPLQRLITASHAGRSEPVLRGILPATLVAGTAIAFAFLVDLGYGHVPWPWGVLAVCLAAVGAGVVGALLFMNTGARFAVIGLFALVAVPLVMAIATYYRAQAAPRVEPVALLRGDGPRSSASSSPRPPIASTSGPSTSRHRTRATCCLDTVSAGARSSRSRSRPGSSRCRRTTW